MQACASDPFHSSLLWKADVFKNAVYRGIIHGRHGRGRPFGWNVRCPTEPMPPSVFRLLLLAIVVFCAVDAHSDAASPRIGILSPSTPEGTARILAGLRQGLREH